MWSRVYSGMSYFLCIFFGVQDDQYGSAIPFTKYKHYRDSEDDARTAEEVARQRKRQKTLERARLDAAAADAAVVVVKSEGEESNTEMKDVDSDVQAVAVPSPHGSTVEVSVPGMEDTNPFAHIPGAARWGRLATRPVLCLSSMFKEGPDLHSDGEESDTNGETDRKEEYARAYLQNGQGAMSLVGPKKKRKDTLDFGPETILCRVEKLHSQYWTSIKPRPLPSPPVQVLSGNEVQRARFANLFQQYGFVPSFGYPIQQDSSAHPPPPPPAPAHDHPEATPASPGLGGGHPQFPSPPADTAPSAAVFGPVSPSISAAADPSESVPPPSLPQSPQSHASSAGEFLVPASPQTGPPPLPSGYGSSASHAAHPPPLPEESKDRAEREPSQPPPLPHERVVPASGLDLTAVAVAGHSGA